MRSFILFFFLCCSCSLFSQENKGVPEFDTRHKNIFIGGLGGNLGLGANFDMRFQKGRMDGPGFRVGFGGLIGSVPDPNLIIDRTIFLTSLNVEFNYLFLQKKRNSMVTGFGVIPYSLLAGEEFFEGLFLEIDDNKGLAAVYTAIGFRAQPLDNGLMFQIRWEPMLMGNGKINPFWAGIAIGFGFK